MARMRGGLNNYNRNCDYLTTEDLQLQRKCEIEETVHVKSNLFYHNLKILTSKNVGTL